MNKDKVLFIIVSVSLALIYIGIWVTDMPLGNKFLVTGVISLFLCLLVTFGGDE